MATCLAIAVLLDYLACASDEMEPLDDAAIEAQWTDLPPQCMGFADREQGIYRVYGLDDPNPKKGDPCRAGGGTAAGGHCNVPCGFEVFGNAIGNKNCACQSGFFVACKCMPLPSIAPLVPPLVSSCEHVPGAPTELGQVDGELFVDQFDGLACDEAYAACISPDLPVLTEDGCAFTTTKGCLCLEGPDGTMSWECGSTNGWFRCQDPDCPTAYVQAGVTDGDLKGSALCQR